MITFTPAQQAIINSDSKLISWLFVVTNNNGTKYYWSTKDIASDSPLVWATGLSWQPGHYFKNGDDNREYTFKVTEFGGISMSRSSSESGIIAPNETSFTIANAGNTLDPDDFDEGTVLISLIMSDGTNKEPIRRWLFDITSVEPQYQTIRFSCVDFLRKYLRGDYPGTKLISDLFPSNIPDKCHKTCVPVPFGTPYVPLKSIYKADTILVNSTTIAAVSSTAGENCQFTDSALGFTNIEYGRVITVSGFVNPANNGSFTVIGSSSEGTIEVSSLAGLVSEAEGPNVSIAHGSRYYLLGSTDKTYSISKCHSPRDISQNLSWASTDSYTFTQSNRSDGTHNWRTFQPIVNDWYESGTVRYPGFWKEGNKFLDMPCKFSRSDTASYTNPSSVIWWVLSEFGIPPKVLRDSSFLACKTKYQTWSLEFNGAFTEKIGREQVLSSLLIQCHSTLLVDDGLTLSVLSKTSVKTLAKSDILKESFSYSAISNDYFQDGGYVSWNEDDEPQDSPIKTLIPLGTTSDRPSSEILDVPFVQDSQDVQRIGRLYFERKYLKKGTVSLGVKTSCLALNPNDIITINHDDYGGTYNILIDTIRIGRDLSISISGTRFTQALNDWEDLAPDAITIAHDDTETAWQPNPTGPGTTQIENLITTTDGHLVQGTNSITVTDLGGADRSISTKKPTFIVDSTVANQSVDGDDYSVADWVNSCGGSENITLQFINLQGSINTDYTFTTDYTIPSYVYLDFQPGARLSIANGVTVTIYSPSNIIAPPRQILTGTGAISFSIAGKAYFEWLGALGDGATSDKTAIDATVTALPNGSVIETIPGKNYRTTSSTINKILTINAHGSTFSAVALSNVGLTCTANVQFNGGTYDNVWLGWSGASVTNGGVRDAKFINQTYSNTTAISSASGIVIEKSYFTGKATGPVGAATYPCFQVTTGGSHCTFRDNDCYNVESGVTFDGTTTLSKKLTVDNNRFIQITYYALKTDVCDYVTFESNYVEDSPYGVFYEATDTLGAEATRDSGQQLVIDGNTFVDVDFNTTNSGNAHSAACLYVAAADNPYGRAVFSNNYMDSCSIGVARGAGRLIAFGNQFYNGYHLFYQQGTRTGSLDIHDNVIDGTLQRYRSVSRELTFSSATTKVSGFQLSDLQGLVDGDVFYTSSANPNNDLLKILDVDFDALTITATTALTDETSTLDFNAPVDWEGATQACDGGVVTGASIQDAGSNYTPIINIHDNVFRKCYTYAIMCARDSSAYPNIKITGNTFDASANTVSHIRISTAGVLIIEGNIQITAPSGVTVDLNSTVTRITTSTFTYQSNSWQKVASKPSTGYHIIGEVWENNAIADGKCTKWLCVTSGTPGTWLPIAFSGGYATLPANDATPSILNMKLCITANTNPTTITDLDDGVSGQDVLVYVNDANTTIDFTGTHLKGNVGADWSPSLGDFMRCTQIGATNWYCSIHDTTT